jgi:hypothetical protein
MKFMGQSLPEQIEMDENLLQSMEVLDDGMEVADENVEEKSELSIELVKKMEEAKLKEPRMGLCKNGSNAPKWGPTLVERQRRTRNDGGTMLQKAMEHAKGNSSFCKSNCSRCQLKDWL